MEDVRRRALALQAARDACYNEGALAGSVSDATGKVATDALDALITFVARDVDTQPMRKKRTAGEAGLETGSAAGEVRELRREMRERHGELMDVLERIASGALGQPTMSGGLGE